MFTIVAATVVFVGAVVSARAEGETAKIPECVTDPFSKEKLCCNEKGYKDQNGWFETFYGCLNFNVRNCDKLVEFDPDTGKEIKIKGYEWSDCYTPDSCENLEEPEFIKKNEYFGLYKYKDSPRLCFFKDAEKKFKASNEDIFKTFDAPGTDTDGKQDSLPKTSETDKPGSNLRTEITKQNKIMKDIKSKYANEKPDVWKNADGNFNTARLASDSIAGVVLGTGGGFLVNHIVKKKQIEKGFDSITCKIDGKVVGEWGDQFGIGYNK